MVVVTAANTTTATATAIAPAAAAAGTKSLVYTSSEYLENCQTTSEDYYR